jgi:hypothetical protein
MPSPDCRYEAIQTEAADPAVGFGFAPKTFNLIVETGFDGEPHYP